MRAPDYPPADRVVAIMADQHNRGCRTVIAVDYTGGMIVVADERVHPEEVSNPDARHIASRSEVALLEPTELRWLVKHAEHAIAALDGRVFEVGTTTQPCPACGAEVPCGDDRGEIADCPGESCAARLRVGKSGLEWRRSEVVR